MQKPHLVVLSAVCLGLLAGTPSWANTQDQVSQETTSKQEGVKASLPSFDWSSMHMGTVISARVYVPTEAEAERYAQMTEKAIVYYDDIFSVHHASPLNSVNELSGQPVKVPEDVAQLTQRSLEIEKDSHGVFQPMIGPVVNLWKIGFGGKKVPSEAEIKKAVQLVDASKVKVQHMKDGWTIEIGPEQSIDLGGIAKGYIGTAIANQLKAAGLKHGFLDLGGNVVVIGDKPNGDPWRVGLQMPNKPRGEFFAIARVKDTSVVTSGAYERFIEVKGKRYAHILSPKTGRPVRTDVASVTIISQDGTFADAWCTALFAMGWDKARQYLIEHPNVACVLMNGDMKQVVVTEPALSMIDITDPNLKLEVIK